MNDPQARTAAAAGGCMLVRKSALDAVGGVEAIRGRIIDDCALARTIKRRGPIWLGLSRDIRSTRRYRRLADTWNMVARTAYEQLGHSPLLLTGAVIGMVVLYVVPPLGLAAAVLGGDIRTAWIAGCVWVSMALFYAPTLRHFALSPAIGLGLPVAGLLYGLMTMSSAWRHWRGRGAQWKGRHYGAPGGRRRETT